MISRKFDHHSCAGQVADVEQSHPRERTPPRSSPSDGDCRDAGGGGRGKSSALGGGKDGGDQPTSDVGGAACEPVEKDNSSSSSSSYSSSRTVCHDNSSSNNSSSSRTVCHICLDVYRVPLVSTACWHVHCEPCWLLSLATKETKRES